MLKFAAVHFRKAPGSFRGNYYVHRQEGTDI